jgi:hypothetical protein
MKFECLSFRKENGRITAVYRNRKTNGTFIVQPNDNKKLFQEKQQQAKMITKTCFYGPAAG